MKSGIGWSATLVLGPAALSEMSFHATSAPTNETSSISSNPTGVKIFTLTTFLLSFKAKAVS
jgi:hypothetical protein